jgi:callose synthase
MYSIDQLTTANVDGITTLFYLQKIYPDEWTNFLERQLSGVDRAQLASRTESHVKDPQELRLWASYRGQTLARTVRGMMYYKYALELQGSQEGASTTGNFLLFVFLHVISSSISLFSFQFFLS